MRGEILSFDDASGEGLISGDDGARYGFDRISVSPPAMIRAGLRVDFVPKGDRADQVMLLASATPQFGDATGAGYGASTSAIAPSATSAIDWKALFLSFDGRIRRSHFWIGWVILFGASLVLGMIPFLGALISLALIWPNLAITVKRLHDMGYTGWLAAIPYVVGLIGGIVGVSMIGMSAFANSATIDQEDPAAVMALFGPAFGVFGLLALVGLGFVLWVGLTPGKPGQNQYGPNPKGE